MVSIWEGLDDGPEPRARALAEPEYSRPVPPRALLLHVWLLSLPLASLGCSASAPPDKREAAQAASTAPADPRAHLELRAHVGRDASCESTDICGFFLQVISPGSDAKDLADKALKILKGKCAGDVIVYRDARNVMGAGSVFASAEEKRSCEAALGRTAPDPDFPSYGVWRVK